MERAWGPNRADMSVMADRDPCVHVFYSPLSSLCSCSSKTKQKYWFKIVPGGNQGRSPKQLPEKYRKAFLTKQIVCVEYHALTDEQERDIFKVGRNVLALNAY